LTSDQAVRVSHPEDQRIGLLGLASVLTFTSLDRRTSPTFRGRYVMQRLLCVTPPDPPPNVPKIEEEAPTQANATIRQRLEADTKDMACQDCHAMIDPFGFALGHFDAIGRYIDTEAAGGIVDSSAKLGEKLFPNGASVSSLIELSQLLAKDPRFHACAAENLARYLVHRDITPEKDEDWLFPLAQSVTASATLPAVTHDIVMGDAFRYRRQPAATPAAK
jgi:hypothetical protein